MSILKWAGNILLVIGLWKIGDKWRPAFLFSIAGETVWTIAALNTSDYALATICTVFNLMALRSYVKWGK